MQNNLEPHNLDLKLSYAPLSTLLIMFTLFDTYFFTPQFVAHWLACLWNFLGSYNLHGEGSWAVNIVDYPDLKPQEKYLICIYWALTTMSTIGYGDLVPKSSAEKVFVIFSMFLGSVIYAYGIT